MEALASARQQCDAAVRNMALHFGESDAYDEGKFDQVAFFRNIVRFVEQFEAAVEDNVRQERLQQQEETRARERAERAAQRVRGGGTKAAARSRSTSGGQRYVFALLQAVLVRSWHESRVINALLPPTTLPVCHLPCSHQPIHIGRKGGRHACAGSVRGSGYRGRADEPHQGRRLPAQKAAGHQMRPAS